jgi:hypothetical protein
MDSTAMKTRTLEAEASSLSGEFSRLYCDPAVFAGFSAFHPISFGRVLPFHSQDLILDDRNLLEAEERHLAEGNTRTRTAVVDALLNCGLLEYAEATHVRTAIDFFDADFFELMGLVYANAGMFKCALRWYRERIQGLETQSPNSRSDEESVYASAGYCLYALGLFEEAIAWSKSCIGPRQVAEVVCEELIAYEVEPCGGIIRSIERSGPRVRYTISSNDPANDGGSIPRLKTAMKTFAPFQDVYLDWGNHNLATPELPSDGYPFRVEFDAGSLARHKMNLIFASCWQADALIERGFKAEAKRVLCEAALVEPRAEMIAERLQALPGPS